MKSIKTLFFFLIFVLIWTGCQQNDGLVPKGNDVLLNNLIGENEWTNSKIIPVNDSLRIRIHQDKNNIYFAVDFHEINLDQFRWTELYIYDGQKHFRFHASGQLGEQTLRPPYWGENWNWGNNKMWIASTQRLAGEARNSSSNQAYEFKFEKKKFKGKELRIYLHTFSISTKANFNGVPLETHFPQDIDKYQADTWFPISL